MGVFNHGVNIVSQGDGFEFLQAVFHMRFTAIHEL